MGQNLTQPEEIDFVLKEMEKSNMESDTRVTDNRPLSKAAQDGWNSGYVSPYRAAYMKAHGLD